jgi:PBP1b-binding outer membrane lipoprotein LpoB
MRSLMGSIAILALILGVCFYAAGWLTYHQTDHTATLELQTDKVEAAAEEAVERGRELLKDITESPSPDEPDDR